jgi:DNA-binding NarL/FixJ family response regulator
MRRVKVLLVDDDARFLKWVRQFLASEIALEIVGEAGDGQEAIRKARILRPDVVLMDVRLPGMTGLEVTQHLKAEMPNLTVIILSIFNLREYRDAAMASGATAFLPKRDVQMRLRSLLCTLGFAPSSPTDSDSLSESSTHAGEGG